MELLTARLKIRDFCPEDFDALYELEADPRIWVYEGPRRSMSEVRQWLDIAMKRSTEGPRSVYKMAVTLLDDNKVCGRLSLKLNQPAIREWEVGWKLHPRVWGQGYASEGARALLDYAFRQLDAHRVVAFCHADNAPSYRVMQRIGMQCEGRLRQARWLNETWHDELVYAILDSEYSG